MNIPVYLSKQQMQFVSCQETCAVFVGGRGAGKTTALCAYLVGQAALNPNGLGLIGSQNPAGLHSVFLPALMAFLKQTGIECVYGSEPPWYQGRFQSHVNVLSCANGWQAVCRSMHDSGADRSLRGLELSTIALDEVREMTEETFNTVFACLRHKSPPLRIRMATTPNGYDWVYRRFAGEDKMPDSRLIRATTMDNRFLPAGYSDMLRSTYSNDLYQQEVLGNFIVLGSGAVYKFNRNRHLCKKEFDSTKPVLFTLDLNVSPLCGCIAQHDPVAKTMHVFDEVVITDNAQTRTACRAMADKWAHKADEVWHICDEAGAARSTRTLESDVMIMQNEMPKLFKRARSLNGCSKPKVVDRCNAVNGMLDSADGTIRLTIDPSCKTLVEDLESVVWLEYGKIDKRDEKHTHSTDSLGYLVHRLFPITVGTVPFGLNGSLEKPVQTKPLHERGFPAPVGILDR